VQRRALFIALLWPLLSHAQVGEIRPQALAERIAAKDARLFVLDVRTPAEYAAGHLPGAHNISHDELAARFAEFVRAAGDREVVVYCRSGRRSALALQFLKDKGVGRLLHLQGDFAGWEASGRPLEAPAVQKP
jgi:rhodanese-related sulfurtransferase